MTDRTRVLVLDNGPQNLLDVSVITQLRKQLGEADAGLVYKTDAETADAEVET